MHIAELNEEYIARMEDTVLAIYEKPLTPAKEPVVCVDEKPVVLGTPMSGRRGPCGQGRIARRDSRIPAARHGQPFSAASSPKRDGTLPNRLRTDPRRSSPITWWRS